MTDEKEPTSEKPAGKKPVFQQVKNSVLGETVAFSVALGAVYASERLLPKQVETLVAYLAKKIGAWRGTSAEQQTILAKKIYDVGIMNIAGISGMAVQFGIRRTHQKPEERNTLGYELARLGTGRIAGTLTALSALGLMNMRAPKLMQKMEKGLSAKFGGSKTSDRIAELAVSNAVQSAGAVPGNSLAQILFDQIVPHQKKEHFER